MKIIPTCLAAALFLAGCASNPPEPSWRINASDSLDSFADAYLKGNTATAANDFARAHNEMASTGRADLVAHAELVRCAVLIASLEIGECTGFTVLAQDASVEERAYAAYLSGHWQGLDSALLPEQHRAIASGTGGLAGIADPLARLVAAGAMLQAHRIAPPDITTATDTASAQGWRRPLLMWLAVSQERAQALGDTAEVERIRRRIAIASGK